MFDAEVYLKYLEEGNYYYIDFPYSTYEPNNKLLNEIAEGKELIKEIRKELWIKKALNKLNAKRKTKQIYKILLNEYFDKIYDEYKNTLFLDTYYLEDKTNIKAIKEYIRSNENKIKIEKKSRKKEKVFMISPKKDYIPDEFKNDNIEDIVFDLANESKNLIEHLINIENRFPDKYVDVYYFYEHENISVIDDEEKNALGYYGRFDTTPIIVIGDSKEAIEKSINELREIIEENKLNEYFEQNFS